MNTVTIKSEIAGTVWKIEAKPGDAVETDDTLLILESMKMEIPVLAPRRGSVAEFRVSEGEPVTEGQVLALFTAG
ncbi:biotin/lipoyl-binding carrier protein [Reyranella soli]|uniref:Acetyl-CoA carboxylase biotin carboxyl carrier protein subunit n=1 Tax=Reyranella soli TaxID=1230389 RepID=A0A512NGC6_9HYPH|nr:biotin/lipoyl-binding carrier protein [Reyranella soli]GEP57998.1 acetyl-CoA carboxylase biotin carboxyl carrier protein subunit [Reyranella soli]